MHANCFKLNGLWLELTITNWVFADLSSIVQICVAYYPRKSSSENSAPLGWCWTNYVAIGYSYSERGPCACHHSVDCYRGASVEMIKLNNDVWYSDYIAYKLHRKLRVFRITRPASRFDIFYNIFFCHNSFTFSDFYWNQCKLCVISTSKL